MINTNPAALGTAIHQLHELVFAADLGSDLDQSNNPLVTFEGLQSAQLLCHGLAARSGWWTNRHTGQPLGLMEVNVPEKLCLIHSEISEAMEGDRKDLMDDKLPHRKMLEVELADALIRIFDLAGFLKLDLAGATIEKLAYNQQRADHKLINRNAEGGKAY
jgi:NTP pyrophosphatase (non-canonical NTP hydrolase)